VLLQVETQGSILTCATLRALEAGPQQDRVVVALSPTAEEMETLGTALALDDGVLWRIGRNRPASCAEFGDALVLILTEARLSFESATSVDFRGVAIVVTKHTLLLVAEAGWPVSQGIEGDTRLDERMLRKDLLGVVTQRVIAAVVESHAGVLSAYEDLIDDFEGRLWGNTTSPSSGLDLWRSRRIVAQHNRVLQQVCDAADRFFAARRPNDTTGQLDRNAAVLSADLHDFLMQSQTMNEIVGELFDTFYAEQSSRLSESSRRLSAGLAIVGVPTALAGLFSLYPEDIAPMAYVVIVVALLGIAGILYRLFRLNDWI
jgi:Mg2+ and Co2+ transporter CorA